jgi:hypothetical protein
MIGAAIDLAAATFAVAPMEKALTQSVPHERQVDEISRITITPSQIIDSYLRVVDTRWDREPAKFAKS